MRFSETPLWQRILVYFPFSKSTRYDPNIVLRNDVFYLATAGFVPRSTAFATQKSIAHGEICRRGEKKPMHEASVFLFATGSGIRNRFPQAA